MRHTFTHKSLQQFRESSQYSWNGIDFTLLLKHAFAKQFNKQLLPIVKMLLENLPKKITFA
jgi:hypothetical protein